MAWIDGTHEETFIVDAPYADVVDYFCDPHRFREAFGQLETSEQVEDGVWRWVLEEKKEKGIKFKADYTVEYTREGDELRWTTRDGGTMKSEGHTQIRDLGGGQTEVEYRETIATDLPIPKLAAKVFRPIVSREIAHGVGDFLDRSRKILEG